jgi:hypothetical protein
MKCFQLHTLKGSSFQWASIGMVCALVAGCGGTTVGKQPSAGNHRQGTEPRAVAALSPPPRIESINYFTAADGSHLVELVGSGFESGAIAEILAPHGHVIGSANLVGDKVRGTAALLRGISDTGRYEVRLKNADGQYSNVASLDVVASEQTSSLTNLQRCAADSSGNLMTLYIGGGDAAELFDQYIAQDADIAGKLPYRLKIKFYEQKESDLALQVVNLGEFEDLFVESRSDFFERMRTRLRGRRAAATPAVQQDAAKEKAQYYQCEPKQTLKEWR